MDNDILFISLCVIVILIFVGVFIFWSKASSTAPVIPSLETTAGQKQSNKKQIQNLAGVYAPAKLNERCAVGTVQNISLSVLLPGYYLPQKCDTGYECIKLADSDPYGYCKAMMGTSCNTVYDCAPPPIGITGIYCNNVCSDHEYGSLLEQCGGNTGYFSCDTTQNLVCNIVPVQPSGICFDRFEFPCQTNQDCPEGTCVKNPNTVDPNDKYCVCPGLNNPVNTKVCMHLDGMPCMQNQECYGGICFKSDIGLTGVCKTLFFPGKECEIDIGNNQGCLNGYACGFSGSEEFSPYGICQPKVLVGTGPNAVQLPAVTDQIYSLCTSYNVLTGPSGTVPTEYLPGLFCDPTKDLVCNYDLGTRGPVGYTPYSYLQGFGTCEVPSAKIGQICNKTTACVPPAVCIQGNAGVSFCSRPQYIDGDPLTFYVNNVNTLNDLTSNSNSIFTVIQNLYPSVTDYNTLNVHLVGGGAGGGAGYYNSNPLLPGTGFFGGAGGGSGNILGYIDASPSPTGVTGTAYYTNTNDSGVYPNPFTIDLNSFEWDDINLTLGAGGVGGNSTTFAPGTNGGSTILTFKKSSSALPNYTFTASGGRAGQNGSTGTNGNGGTGYNGGGAGAGGTINTPESVGGNGLLSIGGQNGFNATIGTQFVSGNGGGLGGGLGGTKFLQVYGSSEGGAGGAGTCVVVKDNNGNIYRTGGDASSSLSSPFNSIPAKPGFNFSGAGAGGGSITLNGNGNLVPQNGGTGGSGYAILRFSKVVKNINYAGKQNDTYKVPASGSSGVCADGYIPNGLNQVSSTAPKFCIPKQYYTCNTQNPNSVSGTFCMNPANTSASGTCGSDYKIGVYIPIPPALQTTLGSNVQNEYFGKWHFLNLPKDGLGNTINPNKNSQLSVYQVFDNTSSMFYPKTRIIYHPYNGLTTGNATNSLTFYYATFDTKDISPNNPSSSLNVTVTWYQISVYSPGIELVVDMKFTSAGNISFYVRESNSFLIPFTVGQTVNSGSGSQTLSYFRIYTYTLNSTTENTMITTSTLTYTRSNYGPMFCIDTIGPSTVLTVTNDPSTVTTNFDQLYNGPNRYLNYVLGNTGVIWDVDDLINNAITVGFKDKTNTSNFNFFSASIPTTAGGLNDLTTLAYCVQIPIGTTQNYPIFMKYYSNIQPGTTSGLGANPQKFLWNSFNLNNNFYQNFVNVNIPDVPLVLGNVNIQKFLLEESDEAYAFGMNFNRITDLGFFDFYYVTTGDQFKYATVSSDMTNLSSIQFNPQELQVDGYMPDLFQNPSSQIYSSPVLSIGNIDRSMYSFVQTCQ